MQIRVSPEAEIEGLDVPEFGALCYPDFVLVSTHAGGRTDTGERSASGSSIDTVV